MSGCCKAGSVYKETNKAIKYLRSKIEVKHEPVGCFTFKNLYYSGNTEYTHFSLKLNIARATKQTPCFL